MSSPSLHFVAFPFLLLSHARQLIALVVTMVKENPDLTFTIFSFKTAVPAVHAELQRANLEDSVRSRIRVIGIVENDPSVPGLGGLGEAWVGMKEAFPAAYRTITEGGSITCTFTSTTYDYADIPAPTLSLADMFIPGIGQAVKEITPEAKVVVFFVSSAGSFIRHYGPARLGGIGEWEETAMKWMESAEEGKTLEEVALPFERPFSGAKYVNAEDVPMYDNELWPQVFPGPPIIPLMWETTKQTNVYADASVLCSTATFEPKSTATAKAWYKGELNKDLFLVGPRFNEGQFVLDQPKPQGDHPVFEFLDAHPPKSVWLISFGTVFFPVTTPNHVTTLLKVLLKNNIPFIFSRASGSFSEAAVPPELEKEIAERKLGLLVDFVPQQEALTHPSMGVFITHGGTSSMWECIMAGVMGVYWPFFADQPQHAAYLSTKLDVAFELIQVRTGPGAIDPARGGKIVGTDEAIAEEVQQVIDDLKGDVGARKRKNLDRVRRETFDALEIGGPAYMATRELVAYGTPKRVPN